MKNYGLSVFEHVAVQLVSTTDKAGGLMAKTGILSRFSYGVTHL
jgi:hypothetical protein